MRKILVAETPTTLITLKERARARGRRLTPCALLWGNF